VNERGDEEGRAGDKGARIETMPASCHQSRRSPGADRSISRFERPALRIYPHLSPKWQPRRRNATIIDAVAVCWHQAAEPLSRTTNDTSP
jgi:aminoglycoside/choline kinase family phosphotransferase